MPLSKDDVSSVATIRKNTILHVAIKSENGANQTQLIISVASAVTFWGAKFRTISTEKRLISIDFYECHHSVVRVTSFEEVFDFCNNILIDA